MSSISSQASPTTHSATPTSQTRTTMSDTYERIPGEIEAKQWDGKMSSALDILEWVGSKATPARFLETNETMAKDQPEIVIQTVEGNKHARRGNWIAYEDGNWLLYTDETFKKLYRKAGLR